MSAPGFLFDENLSRVIATQLRRIEPGMSVFTVGEAGALAKGTSDPQILCWIEGNCSAWRTLRDWKSPSEAEKWPQPLDLSR